MKQLLSGAFVIALLGVSGQSAADTISINFVENAVNQKFVGGQMIGPLATDSLFWNSNFNPTTGTLVAGTLTGLITGTGVATGAAVQWQCTNTWTNGNGAPDDEHRLAFGYLDDGDTGGGTGLIVTITNIPYPAYRIYGLFSSDNAVAVSNFDVNGVYALGGSLSTTADIYTTIDDNFTNNGEYWTEVDPGVVQGNYWTADTTGPTCVITGQTRFGSTRGSLTAVIIEKLAFPPGVPFCFGHTSQGNPCPCANDNDQSDLEAGCANGTFTAGAHLDGSGEASVSLDTLVLSGVRGQPGNSSMFFQAANNLDGMAVFLGDGMRCAGGNLKRLKVKLNDASGDADTTGTVITTRSAALGYTIQAGDILHYQWWYRDNNNPPCGLGVNDSNTSNGYEVTWLP